MCVQLQLPCTCNWYISEFENHILNFSQPYFLQLGNVVNNESVLYDKNNTAGRDFYIR